MRLQAAIILLAVGQLTACGAAKTSSQPKAAATVAQNMQETPEVSVAGTTTQSANSAERPDVKVYRPKKLANIKYDAANEMVTDLDTGDRLVISHGHAGGPNHFGFSNEKTGGIAGGSYLSRGGGGQNASTIVITSLSTLINEVPRFRAREELRIDRIAEMFRAYSESVSEYYRPTSKGSWDTAIAVVDARPEKASEINPQNGIRKDLQ